MLVTPHIREQMNSSSIEKNKKISISIIIPIKNNFKYIKKCLDSVLQQTLKNIEIIIINDGSIDGSEKIIKNYALKDSRIQIINHSFPQGTGKSRNEGLKSAKGEFVAFLDSDDLFSSNNILTILYNKAKLNNAYICGGSLYKIDAEGNIINNKIKYQYFEKEGWVKYEDYQYDGGFYRFIYKNEIIKKYNIFFPCRCKMEDPIFFVNIMKKVKNFYAVKEVVYYYRKNHKKEIWTNSDILEKIDSLVEILKISEKEGYKKLHYLMAKNYLEFCRNKAIKLKFLEKIKFFIKILCNINWNFIYEENNNQQIKLTKIKLFINSIF